MYFREVRKLFPFFVLVIHLQCHEIQAKSIASAASNQEEQSPIIQTYQQLHQHYPYNPVNQDEQTPQNGGGVEDTNYPAYSSSEDAENYDYQSSSSEEMMPVKNSEFVPIEDYSTDVNVTENDNGGHIPQRQVSLHHFWQNPMFHANGQGQVNDQGNIEVVTVPNFNSNNNGDSKVISEHEHLQQHQYPTIEQPEQHFQQYYQQYEHEIQSSTVAPFLHQPDHQLPFQMPTKVKKSNASKLTVEAGRNGEGKIAVVRDKMRARRQKRSMMTLSREDENDSEYDDLNSSEKKSEHKNAFKNNKNNSNSTITSSSTTSKP